MIKRVTKARLIWIILPFARRVLRFFGFSWNGFYATLLDRIERKNSILQIIQNGELKNESSLHKGLYDVKQGEHQLNFLVSQGVVKSDNFLELGLGYGRSAIPLIEFLDKGKYSGTEISKKRLQMCKEWISLKKLDDKKPALILSRDNFLREFEGQKFDVIWAQGVLTHMPVEEVRILLTALKSVMKKRSRFIFNFGLSQTDDYFNHNVKDFYYSYDFMLALCMEHGFDCLVLNDWHQYLHFGVSKDRNMGLCLTVRGN